MLSQEQKRQLKADIETMVHDVCHFCSCWEADKVPNYFPEAKEETARRIIKLLEEWNIV